jgi:ATP-dependent exoDNAse (exonuclease V) alpha subunit
MTTVQLLAPTGSVASRVPSVAAGIELTPAQRAVHDCIISGRNVVLHGDAGTGKSMVIGAVMETLRVTLEGESVEMQVFSDTIARYLRLKPGTVAEQMRNLDGFISPRRLVHTRVIIIDEYGMVPTSHMVVLDELLRKLLDGSKPFGGVQIVLVGDPIQLPPVSGDRFDQSQLFLDMAAAHMHLDQIMRQSDTDDGNRDFLHLLKDLRRMKEGRRLPLASECFLDYRLNHFPPASGFTGACALRSVAKKGNETIVAKYEGTRYMLAKSVEAYEDEGTTLHEGAPIQLTRNIYSDEGELIFYNGQFGTFHRLTCKTKTVTMKGRKYERASPAKATALVSINGRECELSPGEALPIECAYYTTIHRLQGQTIGHKLHVDLTGVSLESAIELAYVGFSRVRHFSQLTTYLDSGATATWV